MIGVLAIQGSVAEHEEALKKAGFSVIPVKTPADLARVRGLIIPGGESTAIGKALLAQGLFAPLKKRIKEGMPVWGTCAGAILLAKHGSEYSLDVLDIVVERNAYGRQNDSFEIDLAVPIFGQSPLLAIFIRAPRITTVGKGVEVLAKLNGEPVLVRHKNILASTFHPELTPDLRVHRFFGALCAKKRI